MTLVVHVSADYPDVVAGRKTRAIAALVEGTRERLTHRVYSLNRSHDAAAWLRPGSLKWESDDGEVAALRYSAPPFGLQLERSMRRVARKVADDIARLGLRPALVHGHKLSFEGVAARYLADQLSLPFVLTLQGNTDQKVLRMRPDLHPLYRAVWHSAAHVMALSPWIAEWCGQQLGRRQGPVEALPGIVASDRILSPLPTPLRIRAAFNLDDWRNKNLAGLARACSLILPEFPQLTLEIAGSGTTKSQAMVDRIIAAHGLSGAARRVGQIPPEQIQRWMNQASVFALPSRRESFGMVFIEALLAGTPIIFPRGAAVDGYFAQAPFAIPVDAGNPRAIAEALAQSLRDLERSKAALALWHASPDAQRFCRANILNRYVEIARQVTQ